MCVLSRQGDDSCPLLLVFLHALPVLDAHLNRLVHVALATIKLKEGINEALFSVT
jgi:hypothetical protein